ncbi:hypothetical protein ACSAGD_09645 [Paramicrobacterium sp. CJ85]|uniref:hypothetical protein n=1 Tax=Paramicrobacterium sp. CJ85 TaxID=3445355 RepID=UPI003F640C18
MGALLVFLAVIFVWLSARRGLRRIEEKIQADAGLEQWHENEIIRHDTQMASDSAFDGLKNSERINREYARRYKEIHGHSWSDESRLTHFEIEKRILAAQVSELKSPALLGAAGTLISLVGCIIHLMAFVAP